MNQKIRESLPPEELLTGMAEEAGELVQAALKLRRALTGNNPTPINANEAYDNLIEELSDVFLYAYIMEVDWIRIIVTAGEKRKRWIERLEKKGDASCTTEKQC